MAKLVVQAVVLSLWTYAKENNHAVWSQLVSGSETSDSMVKAPHHTLFYQCDRLTACPWPLLTKSTQAWSKIKHLAPYGTDGRFLFSGFQLLVTLTLDRVIRHTVVHHSSTSIYIPNFIETGKTFFVDGLNAPSSKSRDTKTKTNIENLARSNLDIVL